jgi:hypothetical protein
MTKENKEKVCFIIMPFSEIKSKTGSISPEDWKFLLENVFRKILIPLGYNVVRGDTSNKSGSIIKDIITNIVNADIVLADLTGLNPNVMYELGVRHALSNRTILLSQNVKSLPFDLRDLRTIEYSLKANGPKHLRKKLKETVIEIESAPKDDIDNPVIEYLANYYQKSLPNRISQVASYHKLLTPESESLEQENNLILKIIERFSSEIIAKAGEVNSGLREYEIQEIATLFNVSAKARFQRVRCRIRLVENLYFDKYPVTNAFYRLFLAETGWKAPKHWKNDWYEPITMRDHPVTGVNYYDIIKFIEWRSNKTGRKYRMPTEIEWEMAARRNKDIHYPWGDTISSENCNCELTKTDGTVPVDSFEHWPSLCGLFDMCGNAWEWCTPWLDDDIRVSYKGDYAVLKGGSWESTIFETKIGYRDIFPKRESHLSIGFRCVRTE